MIYESKNEKSEKPLLNLFHPYLSGDLAPTAVVYSHIKTVKHIEGHLGRILSHADSVQDHHRKGIDR